MKFMSVADGFIWGVANVYGPNDDSSRGGFCGFLSNILRQWPIPWCVGGDFNMIRFPQERKGGGVISSGMERFFDFIRDNELIDFPLVGSRYTWSNNQERLAMSGIDHILVNKEWEV